MKKEDQRWQKYLLIGCLTFLTSVLVTVCAMVWTMPDQSIVTKTEMEIWSEKHEETESIELSDYLTKVTFV